eukprot:jgi/Mesvir1/286/Mv13616-RA.1
MRCMTSLETLNSVRTCPAGATDTTTSGVAMALGQAVTEIMRSSAAYAGLPSSDVVTHVSKLSNGTSVRGHPVSLPGARSASQLAMQIETLVAPAHHPDASGVAASRVTSSLWDLPVPHTTELDAVLGALSEEADTYGSSLDCLSDMTRAPSAHLSTTRLPHLEFSARDEHLKANGVRDSDLQTIQVECSMLNSATSSRLENAQELGDVAPDTAQDMAWDAPRAGSSVTLGALVAKAKVPLAAAEDGISSKALVARTMMMDQTAADISTWLDCDTPPHVVLVTRKARKLGAPYLVQSSSRTGARMGGAMPGTSQDASGDIPQPGYQTSKQSRPELAVNPACRCASCRSGTAASPGIALPSRAMVTGQVGTPRSGAYYSDSDDAFMESPLEEGRPMSGEEGDYWLQQWLHASALS